MRQFKEQPTVQEAYNRLQQELETNYEYFVLMSNHIEGFLANAGYTESLNDCQNLLAHIFSIEKPIFHGKTLKDYHD